MSDLVIASSARKHGIGDHDIMHAYRNPIRRFEVDDGLTMLVGADRAGGLLEIGVVAGDPDPVIVHAMKCRDRFIDENSQTRSRRLAQENKASRMPNPTDERR